MTDNLSTELFEQAEVARLPMIQEPHFGIGPSIRPQWPVSLGEDRHRQLRGDGELEVVPAMSPATVAGFEAMKTTLRPLRKFQPLVGEISMPSHFHGIIVGPFESISSERGYL